MNRSLCFNLGLSVMLSFAAGCGGGGQPGSGGSSGVSISAIAGPDHLQIGVSSPPTYVYSARFTGSSDTAVEWSINDTSVATIDATTGVATPSASKTGTITITATAHADASKTATRQVNVVDWILAGVNEISVGDGVLLVNGDGSGSVEVIPASTGELSCSWAYDHLRFICTNDHVTGQMEFDIFTTDGTAAGTKQSGTLQFAINDKSGLFLVGNPHFSPDGTKIVFAGVETSAGSSAIGTYVVDSAGKTSPVLLAADPDTANDWSASPRFSPDGKEILFMQSGYVWIMDSDGTNQRQLVDNQALNAVFSPDMTALYYTVGVGPLGGFGGVNKANVDGSNPVSIEVSGYNMSDIAPNGESILLQNVFLGISGGAQYYIANADGTGPRGVDGVAWAAW